LVFDTTYSLRRFLLIILSFYLGIYLLGCEQAHQRGKISTGTPLAVIATEPAVPAVLELGEKLVVVIRCEPPTSEPVQVWTRPYKEGNLVRGYKAHHLEKVSAVNTQIIIIGWFSFESPKVIDEVRVFMRDISSNEIVATSSYMANVKWEGKTSTDKKAENASNCNPAKAASKSSPCKRPCNAQAKSPCQKLADGSQATVKRPPPDMTIYKVDIGDSPILGDQDAPVTIVEFGDFQCPYCVKEYPKIKNILQEYPDKVRYVFKHYPLKFHKKARYAHAAAELARREKGPQAFWKMHDWIMANPRKLEISDLRNLAQSLGLDLKQFDSIMADPEKINELLKIDMVEAKKCKVRATPTVLINGIKMTNRTAEGYKNRINQILNQNLSMVK